MKNPSAAILLYFFPERFFRGVYFREKAEGLMKIAESIVPIPIGSDPPALKTGPIKIFHSAAIICLSRGSLGERELRGRNHFEIWLNISAGFLPFVAFILLSIPAALFSAVQSFGRAA